MKCDDVLMLLDDLVDGELDAATRSRIEEHISSCAVCEREWRELSTLVRQAAALPDELSPELDLWPAIAQRIDQTTGRASSHPSWWRWRVAPLLAAAAILVAALAGVLMWRVGGPLPPGANTLPQRSTLETKAIQAAYRNVDDELAKVRDNLRTVLDERRNEISPATMAVVMENLAVIEESILNISIALEEAPENPELNRLLLAACRSEIKLLQRATELPAVVRES